MAGGDTSTQSRPISTGKYKKGKTRSKRKVPVPKKKKISIDYVRSNAKAINSLSNQIKTLQMKSYGAYQTNLQVQDPDSLIPTTQRPILFDLCDFTSKRLPGDVDVGAKYYQYNADLSALTQGSLWKISPLSANVFWKNYNVNRPGEKGIYMPLRADYCVTIRAAPTLLNTRIRFDVFQQKARPIVTPQLGIDDLRLPGALIALQNLTSPEINRLNPAYFRKYWTKVFYINNAPATAATGTATTGGTVRFRFSIKPKQPRKQLELAPNPVPGIVDLSTVEEAINAHIDESDHSSAEGSVDLTTDPPENLAPGPITGALDYSPFNTAVDSPLYMIISTDDASAAGDQVHISMSRKVSWRDWEGASGA